MAILVYSSELYIVLYYLVAGYRIVLRCIDETRVVTASSASVVSPVQRGQATLPPVSMPSNSSSSAQAQAAIERLTH